MNTKVIVAVVVVAVLAGAAFFWMQKGGEAPAPAAPASQSGQPTAGGQPASQQPASQPATQPVQQPASQPQQGGVVDVVIKNFSFSPAEVRIKAGTTVRWTHQDLAGHTVTADDGSFGSKVLSSGKTFEQTFSAKGTFGYHCEPHPSMKGRVIVE